MATKPSRTFQWSTGIALGDDDTRRLDIPADWKTDGADDDDRFLHEYANDTFGLISEWTVYLNGLSVDQIAFGVNGVATSPASEDNAGEYTFRLDHGSGGVSRLSADIVGGSTHIGVGRQGAAPSVNTVYISASEVTTNFARLTVDAADGSSTSTIHADGYEVANRFSEMGADGQANATASTTLYRDNLIKARARVFVVLDGATDFAYAAVAGVADASVFNLGGLTKGAIATGTLRIPVSETSGVIGAVQASVSATRGGTNDLGLISVVCDYDEVNETIDLALSVTTVADMTTLLPVFDAATTSGVSAGLPAGTLYVDLLLF